MGFPNDFREARFGVREAPEAVRETHFGIGEARFTVRKACYNNKKALAGGQGFLGKQLIINF